MLLRRLPALALAVRTTVKLHKTVMSLTFVFEDLAGASSQ